MSNREPPPIIGVSHAVKNAVAVMERFAPTHLPILLVGATGTGKELFACHIHHRSARRGELVDVNCGALPRDMMESLLFGHQRGAFTGAIATTAGYIERASEGTLFLDEILHLSPEGQVKLLRVLETSEVERLGEGRKRTVDLRILSAAQDDVAVRIDEGPFRRDLFQRLAGVVINLPPLADRLEDVLPLATHFAAMQRQVLESGCAAVLEDYPWPGNVRELKLAIQRAECLVNDGTLPPAALRDAIQLGAPRDRRGGTRMANGGRRALDKNVEVWAAHERLLAVCDANAWDARRSAAALQISLSTFYDRLKSAGISIRAFRRARPSEFRRKNPESRDADRTDVR